jgi:hypothetical protein
MDFGMPTPDEWYIEEGSLSHGPYPLAEVFDLIERGKVPPEAWFTSGGMRVNAQTLQQHWPDPRTESASAQPAAAGTGTSALNAVALPTAVPASQESSTSPGEVPYVAAQAAPSNTRVLPQPTIVERDSILILGRRRAGKTIYLATLYSMLWKSVGGLSMKALAGPTHKMLMGITEQLRHGQWPEATLGMRQLEFELNDDGRKRLLVAFDYSGEDFRRAFVEEQQDSPDVKKLLNYLDRAAAVILLIDPAVAVKGNYHAVADDDFGMVQAVERIRNWPGGERVPIVLTLTKADLNRKLLQAAGSMRDFVLRHYPALVRTLGKISIFAVSAVQQRRGGDGRALPAPESVPINVGKPLLYCLSELRRREEIARQQELQRASDRAQLNQAFMQAEAVQATNRRVAFVVAGIVVLGLCVFALIWILNMR